MDKLHSSIDRQSAAFKENEAYNLGLRQELMERLEQVKKGGGDKYVDRHHKRGKLLPRSELKGFSMMGHLLLS